MSGRLEGEIFKQELLGLFKLPFSACDHSYIVYCQSYTNADNVHKLIPSLKLFNVAFLDDAFHLVSKTNNKVKV